ncbi:MAG TPA: TIM barrel protein [Terriglobia bacterium]|jgi:sugar phosphate isomerase/epimerase|nr:TIM barrel protein [Terriglobia bacterium]
MNSISRRGFLGKTAAGLAAAGYFVRQGGGLRANPLGLPIGVQSWEVREAIGKDFDGTLRQLAGDGFQTIEMCSPPAYKDLGFGPLVGMKASEMRERIEAAGLKCQSCHFGFTELKESLDERLAFAKDLGLTQMIISTFWLPKGAGLADWMRAADEANKLGERTLQAGIQLGFHNHDFEFAKLDGQLIYDKLMGELDPRAIKMQFQVAVVRLGYQAADFLAKYPGRFISMHLADWSPSANKEVPLGQGMVDSKRLFANARPAGVQNYFVEMELDVMKASLPYLHGLS